MVVELSLYQRLEKILPADYLELFDIKTVGQSDQEWQSILIGSFPLNINDQVVSLLEFYRFALICGDAAQMDKLRPLLLVWVPQEFLNAVELHQFNLLDRDPDRCH